MLDSFEELKDVALKNLEKCLSSEKMIELSEFAMFVETNRDTEKRISLGKLVDPRGYAHIVTLLIMVTSGTEVQMRQTCSTPPPPPKKYLIRSQTSSMAQNLSQERAFNEYTFINWF